MKLEFQHKPETIEINYVETDTKQKILDELDNKNFVYNVWLCVEKIDERNDDNGKDISIRKLAKYRKEDEAISFALEMKKENETARDKEGFTIK